MNDVWYTLRTHLTVFGFTPLAAPVVSLLALKDAELPNPLIRFWARSILRSAGVEPVVEGRSHLPARGTFVLVVNHQSNLDIPLLLAGIERHLRFVAKEALFRIPLFGPAMRRTGNVAVDRQGSGKDRRKVSDAALSVRERVSIAVFAEGTRSETGALGSFKKGAAVLAIEAQVPLIPAAIGGTGRALPKSRFRVRGGGKVALVIGAPLSTAGLTYDDRDALTQTARDKVAELLERANRLAKS